MQLAVLSAEDLSSWRAGEYIQYLLSLESYYHVAPVLRRLRLPSEVPAPKSLHAPRDRPFSIVHSSNGNGRYECLG